MNLGKALLSSVGSQIVAPTIAGTPFQGGYYVGRMTPGDGFSYALIVAPKSLGESPTSLAIRSVGISISGAGSTWDGFTNTAVMGAAGSTSFPAAYFCRGLSIGGYADWALPAKDQLELIYRNLKPTTTSNITSSGANINSDPVGANYTTNNPGQTSSIIFKSTGSEFFQSTFYWSSTVISSSTASNQFFDSGNQGSSTYTSTWAVRAVRMVKI